MEKRRLSLNRTGGAKNYNSPMKGGPYSAHPVHYKMIEDIHLDLDAMDNEIDKALNSTSTKVRQVAHSFTVLQSIYFNTDTGKWALAQSDDRDTIGTHVVVEVIDKDYFVAGLSGIFEVKNTLDLGYWFTSDAVAGELVDTAPDINNPMIQVIDSNSIRVLDIGIVDNLDSIPASNVIVTSTVTPDFTPAVQGNNLQQVTNKVAGLQNPNLIIDYTVPADASQIILDTDRFGNPLNITTGERIIVVFEHSFVDELGNPANNRCYYRINNIISRDYRALGSNLVSFQLLGVSGYIHYTTFQLIVDRYVHGFGSNNGELIDGSLFVGGINYFLLMKEITALNSLRLGSMDTNSKVKAGSIVKIYKL